MDILTIRRRARSDPGQCRAQAFDALDRDRVVSGTICTDGSAYVAEVPELARAAWAFVVVGPAGVVAKVSGPVAAPSPAKISVR